MRWPGSDTLHKQAIRKRAVNYILRGRSVQVKIGELLWRWTLVSTTPFPSYESLTACFGEV